MNAPTASISAAARRDLNNIADFTAERWGLKQMDKYLLGLDKLFSTLAKQPRLGKNRDELQRNLLSFPHESHVVYYLLADHGVQIVRVLHKHQLPGLYL